MPKLKCDAKTCAFNSKEYCCKSIIRIIGPTAKTTADTACGSYHARKHDTYDTEFASMEASESINQYVSIDCESKNCKFNRNHKCSSDHVHIEKGKSNQMTETMCETFCE